MTTDLMQYIVYGGGQNAGKTAGLENSGPRKYHGDAATGYEAKRENSPKWAAEQKIIAGFLQDLPSGSSVLDVPVGTGRFIPLFEDMKLKWWGFDVSKDMLEQADKKIQMPDLCMFMNLASVHELPLKDDSVDMTIMCRLTRWLGPNQRREALQELKRVTKDAIVFTARVRNHAYQYSYEDITADLGNDWTIQDDIAADGDDYRVIRACPVRA